MDIVRLLKLTYFLKLLSFDCRQLSIIRSSCWLKVEPACWRID